MDVLIEFCRTGRLGPLALGLNLIEVEGLIGPPQRIRPVQGEENRQRARYMDLSVLFTGDYQSTRERANLTAESIQVTFGDQPVKLPAPIAGGLERDWASPGIADVVSDLRATGLTVSLEAMTANSVGQTIRSSRVDDTDVSLTTVDDVLWRMECVRRVA